MSAFLCKFARKPSSVHYGHQSRRIVANTLKPPPENGRVSLLFSHGVAPDRVYSTHMSPCRGWALTSPFHPYRKSELSRRYISVALVRGSPLAGVTRYPYPVEPGLSSRTGFRLMPATIQRTCVKYFTQFVPDSQLIIIVVVILSVWRYNIKVIRGDYYEILWIYR